MAGHNSIQGNFRHIEETVMSDHHTYKLIDLVGSSKTSIEDAINNALAECAKSVRNMDWFEVTETRGHIENGQVAHFQVSIRVGFRISDS